MKLVIILITVACLQVSASALAQKITLNEKDAPLEKVFNDIKKQTGCNFFYEHNILAGTSRVTINVKDASLADVLNLCLANQPLVYTIAGNNVGVKKKEIQNLQSQKLLPPKDITGRVTNKAGEPLSGATVVIKRTKAGTLTAANGQFTLSNVLDTDTLLISFIGYKQLAVKVVGKTVFNLVLEEATNSLDQVVIQAYGQTTQRLNTGDIATVSGKDIEKQPVMNPLLALEGQVPGLDIVQQSGYQSAPVKVELRGRSSINGVFPSDPLYIVDGVPLSVVEVGGNSGYNNGSTGFIQNGLIGPAGGASPLFSINSSDIESITVLKDADALAIYGSRGANGVILITTKKGKAGKMKFNANGQEGFTHLTATLPLLNTQQYIQVREEAFKNDGITPNQGNAYDILSWATNPYTNWEKALYDGVGKLTDIQTSLSGGNDLTTIRIAAGFTKQTYPSTVTGADNKSSLSFNLTNKSVNQKFTVSLTGAFTYIDENLTNLAGNFLLPPDAPSIYDSQGNLNFEGWTPVRGQYPFAGLEQPYTSQTAYANTSLNLSYELVKGLVLKTNAGFNYSQINQSDLIPIASQDPTTDPVGQAQFGNNNNKNLVVEPQITYDRTIGKGKLSTLLGGSYQTTTSEGKYENGYGYTSDLLLKTISDAPVLLQATDSYGQYNYASLFGRINYNWEDKYLINLSARRDGSSKFGPNNRFGNFGALGIAYIFTEEQWVKQNASFLSFGKIRASYGSTGNDNAATYYGWLSRYQANAGLQTYDGITSLQPVQHANPDYQWEVDKKLEFGLDLGFLKDRILLTAVYYQNRVGNQIINYPTPQFTGFTSVIANFPALIQNKGEEFTLKARLIDASSFKWSFNFNIGFNSNELLSFPNLATSVYRNSLIVGQPINIIRLLHYTGVDPLTGQYTFEDKNHDGIISTNPGPTDDRYVYNLNPKFLGGFGTDLSYKDLHLSLFFTYKDQMGFNVLQQGLAPGRISNQPTSILGKEWQYPGDIATVAGFTTQPPATGTDFGASDAGFTNASYIRLRNLSLSYDLPKLLINKIGMESCSLFVRGENLFVISPFKGLDPETQSIQALPPAKILTVGINVNL